MAEHKERKHALLSASGASRWLNCTPSAVLEDAYENSSSSAAEEGTLAHELAELTLRHSTGLIGTTYFDFEKAKIEKNPLFKDEMYEEVQKYVDYVLEQFIASKQVTKDAILLIEDKIDLLFLIEDGFGTCDAEIIADGVLEVIDLKYGKGIAVSANDNSQLKLYALGAYAKNSLLYDIKTIKLTIAQVRLDAISSYTLTPDELVTWGETFVKPRAELATKGEGELCTGEWCKWCRAKAKCSKMAEECLQQARVDFADPKVLTDEQILECYKQLDKIADWAKAVSEYVEKEALAGREWDGYKLVEGRSNRKWSDEDKIKEVLKSELYEEKEYLNVKLKGIGDIEKLVGKTNFTKIVGSYVEKPAGSPTLVPSSDKREPFKRPTAAEDFAK